MGRVPFSFTDVNKDIWKRETVRNWVRNTKKAERRKETQKSISKRLTQRRGRGIEANIQGIKNLQRTEFHLTSINPQARDAIQPERSISVVKCMVFSISQ